MKNRWHCRGLWGLVCCVIMLSSGIKAAAAEPAPAADKGAKATDTKATTAKPEKESGSGKAGAKAAKPKPKKRMSGVEHLSRFMGFLCVLFVAPIFIFIYLAKSGRKLYLRRLPGVDAIDEAIGRAVEMGRPIFFSTGLTSVNTTLFACLGIISHVARRAAIYATRFFVPQFLPEVMAITQDVVHQAYRSAGREDAYDPECIRFLSPQQFAYASGYMGMVHREKAAACFLFGEFAAESLILAEAGQQVGAIQVAGTPSSAQIPFFVTTCDYTIIGEEMFAVSAYLTREPVLLGSLRGQDVAKFVIFLLVIVGVIWATIMKSGGYDIELSHWIIPPA